MNRELCGCGRPRASDEDLARWREEVEPVVRLGASAPSIVQGLRNRGGRYWNAAKWTEAADPAWSRALCWTKPGVRCSMRRRWASDLHIDLAREVFAAYVGDMEEFQRGEGAAAWALS